jgi:hypothetical protein
VSRHRGDRLETIVLNCYVDTTDPATGQPARPHLVTVRTLKETFEGLNLRQVDPFACLRGLRASVSRSPHELLPVRPIVEFDMVDPGFIQESDVLGALDDRPNLMELTPKEFESLMSNLFEKMGLDTRQTQASRDGGVACLRSGSAQASGVRRARTSASRVLGCRVPSHEGGRAARGRRRPRYPIPSSSPQSGRPPAAVLSFVGNRRGDS